MNLAKAFHTVDYKKLINILPGKGIKNESFDWFISHLKNRKQVVSLNGVLSNANKTTYNGVIQVVF